MNKQHMMFALVEQFLESGVTAEAFAAQFGFSVRTLDKWRRLYKKQLIETQAAEPEFIEITPSASEPSSELKPKIEIELPEGIRIKIY